MDRVNGIRKLTDNRFLNLYELDATFRDGSQAVPRCCVPPWAVLADRGGRYRSGEDIQRKERR